MARILVIDDKQDNLTVFCALLGHSIPGCTVITAKSGAEGIEKAGSEAPDTILLDVKMPGMDGFEVCKRLKADPRTEPIPVIMFTAVMKDTESQLHGFETGADAYLTKPVEPSLLAAQVKIALRMKKAEDRLRKDNIQLLETVEQKASVLEESQSRFQSLVEHSIDHVFMLDEKGKYLWSNNRVEGFGLKKGESLIGMYVHDVYPPDVADLYRNKVGEVFEFGRSVVFEHDIKRRGNALYHIDTLYPIFHKDRIQSVGGICHDITDNKIAQMRAAEIQKKIANLMGNLPGMAYRSRNDKNWTLEFASEGCLELTGYPPEDLLFNRVASYNDLIHPEDREAVWKSVQEAIAGKERFELTYRIVVRDGAIKWVWKKGNGSFSDDGQLLFLEGFISDITENREMEAQQNDLEKRLVQAQKLEAIGTLAGGIAHDFNNILTSIIGYTELALDCVEKDSPLMGFLQEVDAAGARAKELVQQILTFARQSNEEIKPVQIDAIAKEALKFIRSSIPTSIEIRQNFKSASLVTGNATQIHQIFMNLCTNAAHVMEDRGGVLEVGMADVEMNSSSPQTLSDLKPGNYVKITISDTGTGIAPEIINSIFDPFFTTKGPGEGTGMGLAMVHGIVRKYGGQIFVESESGKGTVFTIYLPVTQKHTDHRPDDAKVLPSGNERILLVDDELPIVDINRRFLEKLGYRVTTRTSSIEALELFRSKPDGFDLVITDLTMPNMTGDKLAGELIKIRPDISVILCTGYSRRISDETVAGLGIKAFAYKPVVRAELAKTVRKVLDEAKGTAQQ